MKNEPYNKQNKGRNTDDLNKSRNTYDLGGITKLLKEKN